MPSPIGHFLGGIAAGWRVAPDRRIRTAVFLGCAGAAADLDLLAGAHRGPTHSLGAAVLTFIVVTLAARSVRWGSAASAAWGSHVLLDWLATDTSPPAGEMALWPLNLSNAALSSREWILLMPRFGLPMSPIRKFKSDRGRRTTISFLCMANFLR